MGVLNPDRKIDTDILIVGGGVVGGCLAIGLAKLCQKVVLIDIKPKLSTKDWQMALTKRDARVYALNSASLDLLNNIGADDFVRKVDYTQMHVWQGDGRGELAFAKPSLVPSLMGSMVEPSVIDEALNRRVTCSDVTPFLTILNATFLDEQCGVDIRHDGVNVRVCDASGQNTVIHTRLLVGADGRTSAVRRLMGIGVHYLDYHQTAICCAIKTARPHGNTARQAMLNTGTLALLPLADLVVEDGGHWQSVVWTLPTQMAHEYLAMSPRQLADKLALASGFELGKINQIESITSFALSAQVAKTYTASHTLLVGDAAHGVHPLAGQGLNLGLADVKELLDLVEQAQKRGKNPFSSQTLRHYERVRRAKNALMMHSFSAINYAFVGKAFQKEPMRFLRAEMVSLAGKIRPLMDFFRHKASGL